MDVTQYIISILKIANNTKMIVWGGGIRGLNLFDILKKLNINVYAYADNNQAKQNEGVRGLRCFSKEQLVEFAELNDVCIVISPANSKELYADLRQCFEKVFPCETYELLYSIANLKQYERFFPIGHFYSLYPDLQELEKKKSLIYSENKNVLDINLCESEQIEILHKMVELYTTIPAWEVLGNGKESKFRYRYKNSIFSSSDAIVLHCMLRLLKPNKLIEVGSGWSSAVSLDTNEFYMNNSIDMTFIEPYSERLKMLLKGSDNINLLTKDLQEVPVEVFESLEAGDFLFIDSTHVSKIGSDVNYLFFEIMPRLKSGVFIHFHDIFYPFEYPEKWIKRGQIWNELYLLRAFLQNNEAYRIIYFQSMMEYKYREIISDCWPLAHFSGGGSFYIKKL